MANSNGWGDGAANNAIGWGQGANNAIGWGDIHADSWAGLTDIVGITTDPDAQAFITAAAITDSTQQSAINQLVVDLKGYGIWSKMKALYPFVGGTSSTHKWNLKDPRDLDAAFRLVFSGGVTHSTNGVQFGGINGWAETYLNPNTVFTNDNSFHGSIYSRTNSAIDGADWGGLNGSARTDLWLKAADGNTYNRVHLNGITVANSNSTGFYVSTRNSSTSLKLFKNNTQLGSTYTGANGSRLDVTMPIGSYKVGTTPNYYSNRQYAFASIGDGLTDTEAANFYTAVQAFQTALGRQVGTPIPLTGTLLNDYPDAAAAYSLRKLRTAYTGSAIRVRRSSDNTEQDFGFVNNVLDTASLLTFCGAGNGFVTTWYDQSGNGVNATQSTAVNQPQIVSSGVLISVNSNNAIRFNSKFLTFSTTGSLPSNISVFAVRNLTTYPTSYNTLFNYKTYGLTHNLNGGTAYGVAHIFSNSTSQASLDYPTTTGQALDFIFNQANLERNNFVATLPNGNVYAAGSNSIGSWSGTSQLFNGEIQELVIYESNQNTNKAGIKSNINTFYTIY